MPPMELLDAQAEMAGDGFGFGGGDPDVTWSPAATIAALRAFEAQTVRVPGQRRSGIAHDSFPQHFLYFFPEPQGQGSLRPTAWSAWACSTGASGRGGSSGDTTGVFSFLR